MRDSKSLSFSALSGLALMALQLSGCGGGGERPGRPQGIGIELFEAVDDQWVEVLAALGVDLLECVFDWPGALVGALVGDGVECVGEGDDSCAEWDGGAAQAVWVSLSVPAFVVAERDLLRYAQ